MIGNSGTGKTLLAQTIAKMLNVPFLSVDATTFTPSGYKGKDVESIIVNLLKVANNDKSKAEKGIIFLDEFDKIAGKTSNGTMSEGLHTNTQSSFLKLFEGEEIEIEAKSDMDYLLGSNSSTIINTKNILFICGGAFAGIEEYIDKQDTKNKIGFGVDDECENNNSNDINVWENISAEEIIKYGMMPEIVGRVPVILILKPLEKDDLINILTKPKNAIVKQYQKLLSMDSVYLDFSIDALELIAEMAIGNKTGARGLRGVLEKVMTKIMYNVPDDEYERRCIITAEHIKNNIVPEFNITVDSGMLN